ncbi:(4Fe-4S)-binding protein [Methanosarcinales archaeon]|nr:MAG: (4Fe-4S)-binding protein [Methanosarcinales archaeon]
MKEIAIVSGKGGTGKTTVAVNLAALSGKVVLADCDVDAPNLHLYLNPHDIISVSEFRGSRRAHINQDICTRCEKCSEVCRFGAIDSGRVDKVLCEGCGVCAYLCPNEAIELREEVSGYIYVSMTRLGYLSYAKLKPGERNSGKLATLVRDKARDIGKGIVIIDGPPGIGCPVIASVVGTDLALAVVEPSTSGIHDLKRVLSLLTKLEVPFLVCINNFNLNLNNTAKIESFCREQDVEVVGRIPFDKGVLEAFRIGSTVVEEFPESTASIAIKELYNEVIK